MSYDTEPCEGRQASPSTPNQTTSGQPHEGLTQTVVLRCTAAEKIGLRATAKTAGVTVSALLRETLGLVRSRRRKPVPRADPALILAVARIGGNLNQIARQLNRHAADGPRQIEAVAVATQLVAIERQLARLTSKMASVEGGPSC